MWKRDADEGKIYKAQGGAIKIKWRAMKDDGGGVGGGVDKDRRRCWRQCMERQGGGEHSGLSGVLKPPLVPKGGGWGVGCPIF